MATSLSHRAQTAPSPPWQRLPRLAAIIADYPKSRNRPGLSAKYQRLTDGREGDAIHLSDLTIAIGPALAGRPSHGSVRAELPHTALTLDGNERTAPRSAPLFARPAVHATRVSGTVSGPVATTRRSPWSVPFPPPTPRMPSGHRCSPASLVLWNCLTPRKRARRTCGVSPSPTDPLHAKRMFPGSPGFREESFQPCMWSQTPWGRRRACHDRSTSLLPSP